VEKATAKEAVFDSTPSLCKGLMGSIIVPESGLRDVKRADLHSRGAAKPQKPPVWLPLC